MFALYGDDRGGGLREPEDVSGEVCVFGLEAQQCRSKADEQFSLGSVLPFGFRFRSTAPTSASAQCGVAPTDTSHSEAAHYRIGART